MLKAEARGVYEKTQAYRCEPRFTFIAETPISAGFPSVTPYSPDLWVSAAIDPTFTVGRVWPEAFWVLGGRVLPKQQVEDKHR